MKTAKAKEQEGSEAHDLKVPAGVVEVLTFRETAPKGAASPAQPPGAAGGQGASQAHRHNNGANGSPATKDKRGKAKERAKEERDTVQKAKGKAKVGVRWASSGKHPSGDHRLDLSNSLGDHRLDLSSSPAMMDGGAVISVC